jgi:2-furoyl-CoA dehydrogenase FAD binding subunit
MKPRQFDYFCPESVEEAVSLLVEHGEGGRVLAGGQSLMAMLNLRLAEPEALIDVSRLAVLDTIREIGGKIEVGAAVTQNKFLAWPQLAEKLPLVAKMLPFVGHFQTRNKGTVCGSIAHSDPSSELPLALAMLNGEVVLRSKKGTRVLLAKDFQLDMLTTAREPDELITAVRFPVQRGKQVAFREVARRHGDFAIIAIAAIAEENQIRLGVGGMTGRPALREFRTDGDVAGSVEAFASELGGYDDMHASAGMRRDLLRNLGPVVMREALQCAK